MQITLLRFIIQAILLILTTGCSTYAYAAYSQGTFKSIMGSDFGASAIHTIGLLAAGGWIYSIILMHGGLRATAWKLFVALVGLFVNGVNAARQVGKDALEDLK